MKQRFLNFNCQNKFANLCPESVEFDSMLHYSERSFTGIKCFLATLFLSTQQQTYRFTVCIKT